MYTNQNGDQLENSNREMYSYFNGLTPEEHERLTLLVEECGEVIQIVGKIFRHGMESTHPDGGPTNRKLLAKEVGDLFFATHLLCARGDINFPEVLKAKREKNNKVGRYLHHNIV